MRSLGQFTASVVSALVAGLLSLVMANAESAPDNAPSRDWDEVFAQVLADKVSISRETDALDGSALGYSRSARSGAAAVRWLPQPLPAVDGINAKIDGFGGGASHSNGFYGTTGSLSVPLARQWGLQLDGGVGSDKGIGAYGGAGHLFWRDPSIGLLGAYGSYSHWNGTDFFARFSSDDGIQLVSLGQISANIGRYAGEGEYYAGRWSLSGVAGVETVSINSTLLRLSVPDRFFDHVSVAYYVTDNFKLSAGHLYTFDTHFLTLGSEYGFGLGGGRMAALFAEGALGEGGVYAALAGLRIYFGQHDKPLIERHRQDDPPSLGTVGSQIASQSASLSKLITAGSEATSILFADAAIFQFKRAARGTNPTSIR